MENDYVVKIYMTYGTSRTITIEKFNNAITQRYHVFDDSYSSEFVTFSSDNNHILRINDSYYTDDKGTTTHLNKNIFEFKWVQ